MKPLVVENGCTGPFQNLIGLESVRLELFGLQSVLDVDVLVVFRNLGLIHEQVEVEGLIDQLFRLEFHVLVHLL